MSNFDKSGYERQNSYIIGGKGPYGWTGAFAYDEKLAPIAPEGLTTLYERLGNTALKIDKNIVQNPPFLGAGNVSSRVPSWMTPNGNDPKGGTPHRILRGFIRRAAMDEPIKVFNFFGPLFGTDATTVSPSTNARLNFMFNPYSIERVYAKFADLAGLADYSGKTEGTLQASILTSLQFELNFDRQEEVANSANHPGVLIDLAVFDIIVGANTSQLNLADIAIQSEKDSAAKILKDAAAAKTADASDADVVVTATGPTKAEQDAAAAGEESNLKIDTSVPIYVVFGPNIAYHGVITAVGAKFLKFSHRMTPTVMTLNITMNVDAFNTAPKDTLTPTVTTTTGTGIPVADSGQPGSAAPLGSSPALTNAVDAQNDTVRRQALYWGQQWLPGKATPAGVPYENDGRRMAIYTNDSLTDFTGIHIPQHFDCSSFVARCLNVVGWADKLGLILGGNAVGSDWYTQHPSTDSTKPDPAQWDFWEFKTEQALFTVAGDIRPGDLLMRLGHHIMMVNTVDRVGPYKNATGETVDPLGQAVGGQLKFQIIHSPGHNKDGSGKPVETVNWTLSGMMKSGCNYMARPKVINVTSVKNHPGTASTGTAT